MTSASDPARRRKETLKKCLAWAGAICAFFVVWGLLDLRVRRSFAPAKQDIAFEEFTSSNRRLGLARVFEYDGNQYFEVLGKVPTTALFYGGSGPPAYVFNSEGRLVDWTPDRGDTTRYVKKWGSFGVGSQIALAEVARRLMRANESGVNNAHEP